MMILSIPSETSATWLRIQSLTQSWIKGIDSTRSAEGPVAFLREWPAAGAPCSASSLFREHKQQKIEPPPVIQIIPCPIVDLPLLLTINP